MKNVFSIRESVSKFTLKDFKDKCSCIPCSFRCKTSLCNMPVGQRSCEFYLTCPQSSDMKRALVISVERNISRSSVCRAPWRIPVSRSLFLLYINVLRRLSKTSILFDKHQISDQFCTERLPYCKPSPGRYKYRSESILFISKWGCSFEKITSRSIIKPTGA